MKVYKVTVDEFGNIRWYNEQGQLHREEGPAVELHHGTKEWFINGKRHREDGPAVEFYDGCKIWYLNGQILTKEEFYARTKPKDTCDGKVIEMDGKKYKLTEI